MKKSKFLTALIVLGFIVAGTSAGFADTWTSWDNSTSGIDNKSMRDVEIAGDGTVWIATYGSGISKYDGTNWTAYKTGDGLVNNTT